MSSERKDSEAVVPPSARLARLAQFLPELPAPEVVALARYRFEDRWFVESILTNQLQHMWPSQFSSNRSWLSACYSPYSFQSARDLNIENVAMF
jgi:hypothetical protein